MGRSQEKQNDISADNRKSDPDKYEKATFAAGCFWGVEEKFRQIDGVISTSVGYIGGAMKNPTYHDVCSGRTGHAEAVEIIYNRQKVTYEQLLKLFWNCHNPTTLNRQGPDIGKQYRSAIFCHNPNQLNAAKSSKNHLESSGRFEKPIVTQIAPAGPFYRAEEYHQQYLKKRGIISCQE